MSQAAKRVEALGAELAKVVGALITENAELARRIKVLDEQLCDAMDGVYELKRRIEELETLNAEMRELKGIPR